MSDITTLVNRIRAAGEFHADSSLVQIANELADYAKDADTGGRLAFSVPDAAKAAGLSVDWVWKLVAAGTIRSIKRGKRRLILAEDLKRYLTGDTQ